MLQNKMDDRCLIRADCTHIKYCYTLDQPTASCPNVNLVVCLNECMVKSCQILVDVYNFFFCSILHDRSIQWTQLSGFMNSI